MSNIQKQLFWSNKYNKSLEIILEINANGLYLLKSKIRSKLLWEKTKKCNRVTSNDIYALDLMKAKYHLQAFIINNGTGKNFLPWYKNINLQGFNKILTKIWEIYTKHLENTKDICNADINKVPAIAIRHKIGSSLQIPL